MNITATVKLRHGDLWTCLRKVGWSQAEMARRAGCSTADLGRIVNLQHRPSQKLADAIQLALGKEGVYLDVLESWPDSFNGFGHKSPVIESTADVPEQALMSSRSPCLTELHRRELAEALDRVKETLTEKEQIVMECYRDGLTLDETGKVIGRTNARAWEITHNIIRKCRRYPRRALFDGFKATR